MTVSRRFILAAAPATIAWGASANLALAQPTPAEPVSFYLGQVLALATLQAQAVGRLQPLLAQPNTTDPGWQANASAEAGVIGAVAGVVGAMEPPTELAGSIAELRLAATAYTTAAGAARLAAGGDASALPAASASLAEGANHILLWLSALTAETGNDWGDGLRILAEGAVQPAPALAPEEPAVAEAAVETVIDEPVVEPAESEPGNRENRQKRENRQNRENRENRQNQQNQDDAAAQ